MFILQTYQKCTAEVDPIVVASIPDLYQCILALKSEFGIETIFSDDTGSLTLIGSLLQIQTAQSRLDHIFREQQDLQQRELLSIEQACLETPTTSLIEPFSKLTAANDGTSFNILSEGDVNQTDLVHGQQVSRRFEAAHDIVGKTSATEEYERLRLSLPAMHVDLTDKPPESTREDAHLVSSVMRKPLASDEMHTRCTRDAVKPVPDRHSHTQNPKRSVEQINDLGLVSPQREFPATTLSRSVDDIFARNKSRSSTAFLHEVIPRNRDSLHHSLPSQYETAGISQPNRYTKQRTYTFEDNPGNSRKYQRSVDDPNYQHSQTTWSSDRLSDRTRTEQMYHSLPITPTCISSSRAAAHGFGHIYDHGDAKQSVTVRSVDHKSDTSARTKQTTDLDTNVVNYIQKIHTTKVREMEIYHQIVIFYERMGEITTVHFTSKDENDNVRLQIQAAKEEFISFYQTIFYSVVKETIAFDPEKCPEKNCHAITNAVKTAFASTLYVSEDIPGEIMIVGAYEQVTTAAEWIKLKLGLKQANIGEEKYKGADLGSRAQKLRGVRSDYSLDEPSHHASDPQVISPDSRYANQTAQSLDDTEVLHDTLQEKPRSKIYATDAMFSKHTTSKTQHRRPLSKSMDNAPKHTTVADRLQRTIGRGHENKKIGKTVILAQIIYIY